MSKITVGKCRKNWYNYRKRTWLQKGGYVTKENSNTLLTRYQIKEFLKKDTDTIVYLAEQTELRKQVIIKQIRITPESQERFYWETQILKNLKHPNIPLLYDIQKDKEYYYIIEEYVQGESLKSVVERQALSVSTALRYTIQLCTIFKYLHEHQNGVILYLDCQPGNIILSNGVLNLVDFGNSVFAGRHEQRNYHYGTIGYAAPELYNKDIPASPMSDVYGIGALLYYMLTGNAPSTGKTLTSPKIPKKISNIIEKCMCHQPNRRYRSVCELTRALQSLKLGKKEMKKTEPTSLVISIAGTDRRAGTTHLGMSLAVYLKQKRYHSLFIEQTLPGVLTSLLEFYEKGSQLYAKNGVFWYKDVAMLPYYGETVAKETEDIFGTSQTNIIINDFGCLCEENAGEYSKADVCLLIGGGKPWEFYKFSEKLEICKGKNILCLINNVSGLDFYKATKNQEKIFMRMPYFANWQNPGKVGNWFLEQLFFEIQRKERGEGKN